MTTNEIITAGFSLVNLILVIYIGFFAEKNKRQLENKSYWFKQHILKNDLEDLYNIVEKLIDILEQKNSLGRRGFVLEIKNQIERLRLYFEIIQYIDKDMSSKIKNYIGLIEGEIIQNSEIKKEDILFVKRILISSLYNYEMNGYKEFNIDYSRGTL
ncbi:MAG: hypothetical protein ACRDAQ_07070 [Cetobacterium sp.]